MKNILYIMLLISTMLFAACSDENLPTANFNTLEASSLKATPGDMEITLAWEPMEGANVIGYYLSWTATDTRIAGGEQSIDGNTLTATIKELVNDETYTFSIQPVYKGGRGGKISVRVKPVTSRVPASNVVAVAGNQQIRLQWEKPTNDKLTGYKLRVNPTAQVIDITTPETESYFVTGLANGIEYTLSLVSVYSNGESEPVTVVATPGDVVPIVVAKQYLLPNESVTFQYNDLFFMGTVASVLWDFGDSATSTEISPTHTYAAGGNYEVKVKVTYADGTSETGAIRMYVIDYAWQTIFQTSGVYGEAKASTPVFGLDGTVYMSISGPDNKGDLMAFDPETGAVKWTYPITRVTYGGGPAVGTDGTIYTGARNRNLYAIAPNGSLKWSYAAGGNIDCFPAIASDGTIYVISNNNKTLHSIQPNGTANWTKELEGAGNTVSSVAIHSDGKILAGTSSNIYAFNAAGDELWKTVASATEISTFAIHNETLYAGQKGGKGIIALSISSGAELWSYAIGGNDANDAYSPIIGKDGSIYFAGKNSKRFYAVNPDGSAKWTANVGADMIYISPVIDENGIIYFGTGRDSSTKAAIFALNSIDGSVAWKLERSTNSRFFAGASIGLDKKLYTSSLGTGSAVDPGQLIAIPIFAGPESTTWSSRGGNIYGNNRK